MLQYKMKICLIESTKQNVYMLVMIHGSIMQPASFQKFQCFAWMLKNARHLLQTMQKSSAPLECP